MGMADAPVRWPDEVDGVIRGDLTAASRMYAGRGCGGHRGLPDGSGAAWGGGGGFHHLAGIRQEAGADHRRPACGAGLPHS